MFRWVGEEHGEKSKMWGKKAKIKNNRGLEVVAPQTRRPVF